MACHADIRDSRISIQAAAMLPFSLLFMILALPLNVSGGDTAVDGVPGFKLKERRLPSRRYPTFPFPSTHYLYLGQAS